MATKRTAARCVFATTALMGLFLGAFSGAGASVAHKTYKPGEFCATASLGKTTKDGTLTLVCNKVPSKGKTYSRWERR